MTIKQIYLTFWYLLNIPILSLKGVKYGKGLSIRGVVFIKTARKTKKNTIFLGNNVCINSSRESDPIGGDVKTIFFTLYDGEIHIADNVGLSNTTIVARKSVCIGENTNIGAGVRIYDNDFHSLLPEDRLNGDRNIKVKGISIGKNVFIGAHCIILKGVTIGDNSVVGAGSVVTKNIPDNEIWAGNPARFVKKNN